MKLRRIVIAALPAVLLALAPAGEAAAKGACVYVTIVRGQKSLQCADGVPNQDVCNRKSVTGSGEFHPGQVCDKLDYAFHPGPGPIPPPAKPSAETMRPRPDPDYHKRHRRDDR